MKDLTHYFVSPERSRENIEQDTSINNLENAGGSLEKKSEGDGDNREETDGIVKKKRSRVKIRISLKDSKNNNNNNSRCDIIDSKNDVVDKTPSPFKKLTKNDGDDEDGVLSAREETPDAFKLLMTRKKTLALARSDAAITPTSKEYKAKLKQSKERLVVLAERKGYSKRKHAEIEEAELIEKTLEKRARLFRLKDDEEVKKNKNEKKYGRKSERAISNLLKSGDNRDDDGSRSKNKKGRVSDSGKSGRDEKEPDRVRKTDNESLYSPFGRGDTPKSKVKWSLRVKLQACSDDDDDGNDQRGEDNNGNGNLSYNAADDDDDHIFTPKSRDKLGKRRTRKMSSDVEVRDEKKPADEIQKPSKREEIVITDSSDSSKRGKHRIKKNRKKQQNSQTVIIAEEEDLEILDSNSTDVNDCPKILQEKKLAPLFVKRSKPNPAAIEARKCFLHSGIPETVKKKLMEQKSSSLDLGTSSMPFPTISHVYQSESEPDLKIESKSRSVESFYKQKSEDNQQTAPLSFDLRQFKSLSNFGIEIPKESIKPDVKIPERENFETILKDVESRCSDARKIWESVSSTLSNPAVKKSPKRRTRKLKLQRKSDPKNPSPEENPENPNPTWTCKYKPMSSVDVVGNESAISKLRNWLNGWRLPSPKDDRSSGDEFYSSDCSSSSYYENNQVAVLLGPYGSGKTASVYAIAEELGYRVLEVNASSKRTGRKILADFQEATKSHRVKRDQRLLLPTKKKSSERKVPQNSLILIEDVDLIFEEDEGFVSATFQLAANTRRPIVMTCKEACPYLNRMAPQQQIINFQTASGNRVAALLELIAFAESGYRLPKTCLDILLRNGDLRQSLLQLQYILLSGPPAVSQLGISPVSTWTDLQALVYKPAIKSGKKNRKEPSAERDRELVESLADKLDSVSLISSLTELENPASPPWNSKLNPSLSLLEDFRMYSNSAVMSAEIADWLRIASIGSDPAIPSRETSYDPKAQLAIKRKVKIGIDLALSQAIPSTLEHRSTSTDYLPLLRTMCRSEEDRASINTKRGKRFHNYLHGLNLASASSNILAAASSVFRDKT